ncbi:MAG: type II toxin-antitoxin system RelB/DinJ family antitoxin [Prevotellaceae bacterium]|nr:type II toxin-antitoxin system RelB/DinJ family antitoxin [Candidatus Colivivens caballi]
MAQSAMTVRLDSQMKSRFDELCVKFGMSANTAINVFVNAVVRTQSIPFSIATNETPGERALRAFEHARQSIDYNEPEMTLDEINEEIRLARAERKAKLGK